MRLKTFSQGGVHPRELKLSAGKKIEILPPPETVIIPVSQHLGAPSKVLVEKMADVKTGQLIAKSDGFISTNIHASVSGKVLKIDDFTDTSGYRRKGIQIKVSGDEWEEGIDRSDDLVKEFSFTSEEIRNKILEAGIVGLGGATFPSHVKLMVPKGKSAEYMIINGVECEPYLTADHALMMERGEQLVVGIKIMMKGLGVEKAILGIEANKPDAIQKMKSLTEQEKNIHVRGLKVRYPQGGEKQLIQALLNRRVPGGGLPIDVGVVVFNVGTVYAAYEAVQKNKPLIERVVTVTGKSLREPSNFLVRIGTPVSYLIEKCGGLPADTGKVISGGPMMGKALTSLEVPIVKGSSGILLMQESESHRKEILPCIRCSKCISACPMGLEPYLLMALGKNALFERMEEEKVLDCIECGSCSYVCPSARPLLDYIRFGKAEVNKLIRSRKAI
ncbi:MAG: electron transport complex subunit RsxC [Bacteroidales bacterium]|nr:electron transport complex subunit RsxC [Bacteroidales bacterium]MBN2699529.1 electron transport complex subunit RsxC [Bacteroidales bacterium]